MTPPVSFQTLPVQQQKQTETAELLRKHGSKTGEEFKAEGPESEVPMSGSPWPTTRPINFICIVQVNSAWPVRSLL